MAFGGFSFGKTPQQQQQQQQPQGTPGGFGGFGQTTTPAPAFGQSQPGAFGQTQQNSSPFGGGGGGFGSNTLGTSTFGQTTTNTGGFGGFGASQPAQPAASSGFSFGGGSNNPAPVFGSSFGQTSSTPFGQPGIGDINSETKPPDNPLPVTEGTKDAPVNPASGNKVKLWRDLRKHPDGKLVGEELYFDSITALPMYWKMSVEELRAQDYAQGRKTAPEQPAGAFGAVQPNNPFGQPAGSTGFGVNQPANPFGGSSTTTGAFGSSQPAATGTTFGGFGAANNNSPFGAKPTFGAPATNTQPPTFSFGGGNTATTGTTGFGSTNQTSTGFGGFGQSQNKPTFSFGSNNNTATTQPGGFSFGGGGASTSTFGQPQQQQQQTTGFGTGLSTGFGNTGNTGFSFGAKPAGTTAFGQQTATDPKPAFSFGNPSGTAATQPASTGFSFGQNNTNTTQNQPANPFGGGSGTTTGLFGQPAQGQNNTSTSLFGQNNQSKPTFSFGQPAAANPGQTQAPSFSFGGANNNNANNNTGGSTGFGLFGQNNNNGQQQAPQQQNAAPSFGGFGSLTGNTGNNANTGLGGGTSTFGGFGGFGQSQQNQNQNQSSTGGFSLGSTSGAPSFGGLFGQSANQNQNPMQQSQFGQSNNQQQQQQMQTVQTFIDQNPYGQYGNSPIFANVAPASAPGNAQAASGSTSLGDVSTKKQPAMSVSYRRAVRPASPAKLQLRGFASSTSSPSLYNSRFGSPAAAPSTPLTNSIRSNGTNSPSLALDLSRGVADGFTLSPQAFVGRQSVKKLVIEPKKPGDANFLFNRGRTATPAAETPNNGSAPKAIKPAFSASAELTSRVGSPAPRPTSSSMQVTRSKGMNGVNGGGTGAHGRADKIVNQDGRDLSQEEWYCEPSWNTLKGLSQDELSRVRDLVVGRKGMGQIAFQQAVDLSGLSSLADLFENNVSIVYEGEGQNNISLGLIDSVEESDGTKHPYMGLERPSIVTIEKRFPKNQSDDPDNNEIINKKYEAKMRKTVGKMGHEFISWSPDSGKLVFKVEHFSIYTFADADSDDEDETGSDDGGDDARAAVKGKRRAAATPQKKAPRVRDDSPQSDSESQVSEVDEGESRETADESDDAIEEDDDMSEAPPRATLDDSMTEMDEEESSRSLSRTPGARSPSAIDHDHERRSSEISDVEPERRKRSIVVPTPRFAPTSRLRNLQSPEAQRRSGSEGTLVRRRSPSQTITEAPRQKPLAQRLGLEPKKMAVMQASFFSKPREEKASVPALPTASTSRQPFAVPVLPKDLDAIAEDSGRPQGEAYIPVYKPLRKWKTVPFGASMVHEQEGQTADAGLMLGRSFRVCFGPNGQLVRLGNASRLSSTGDAAPLNVVKIDMPAFLAGDGPDTIAFTRLLDTQLDHTEFVLDADEDSLPLAVTRQDLRFHHFTSGFTSQDTSHEALLWRLGRALFDEINLQLPEGMTSEVQQRVSLIRRRNVFSAWLKAAVAPAVEDNLRSLRSQECASQAASMVFVLLTGNQIERACQVALDNGDVRLATLLAQAGGDDEYRADIDLQLAKWREYRVDPHIGKTYRKIYELLSGNVRVSPGVRGHGAVDTSEDIAISEGLDWKRTFALRFWYGTFDTSIPRSLREYTKDIAQDEALAKPLPQHELAEEGKRWHLPDIDGMRDVLYELVRMFTDPAVPLESVLSPRAFTSSPFDYRQSWHLYQLLTNSLQIRDFEDRDAEGNSSRAEEMAVSYADQLEKAGEWTWAAFVLLHLKDTQRREKAIRELLARHAEDLGDAAVEFLTGKLSIPSEYVKEAREEYTDGADNEERASDSDVDM